MIRDVTFEKTRVPGRRRSDSKPEPAISPTRSGSAPPSTTSSSIGMANIAAYEHELLDYATAGPQHRAGPAPHRHAARQGRRALLRARRQWRTEEVGKALDQEGIAVRAGHHCAQPILRRFGHESTVRPSFALYNTPEDVDALVAALHRLAADRGRHGF